MNINDENSKPLADGSAGGLLFLVISRIFRSSSRRVQRLFIDRPAVLSCCRIAKTHAAEADAGNPDVCGTECRVFHGVFLSGGGWAWIPSL